MSYSKSFLLLPGFLLLSGMLLSGCASNQALEQTTEAQAEPVAMASVEASPVAAETATTSIDEQTLLVFLTGEIAAQRGQLDFAFENYLQAATATRDVYAARRATRIALFRKNYAGALKASRLWVEFAPESIQARNSFAVLLHRNGDSVSALENFHQLHALAVRQERDPFMIAALSLAKETDQQATESLMRLFVEAYATDARAFTALGILQSAFKAYDRALLSLQQAAALDPDKVHPQILSVRVLVEQKKNDEAIAYLENIIDRFRDEYELGLLYAKLLVAKDLKKSYLEFERLHRLKPDEGDVIVALGLLSVQLDDIAMARKWWQQLLDSGDRDQRSHAAYQLGQLAELAGNTDEAAAYYKRVHHGDYQLDARVRLARIEASRGDVAGAQDIFKQLRVLNPSHVTDYYIAEAQLLQKHLPVASVMEFYHQALAARPGEADLLYARGLYAADQYLVEQAERDFREVLKLRPDDADALNALGYTLADQTDRYQEAFVLIKKAYDMRPENAAILDSMGWVNYRMGNFELALSYLQKALSKVNDDEIAAHLGEVLWVMGQTAEAREIWQKAIKDFPDSDKLSEVMRRLDR